MKQSDLRLHRNQYLGDGSHIRVERRTSRTFPLHSHEFFEMEIVLEGGGTQWLNGQEYTLEVGSVYCLSPADFHEVAFSQPTVLWNVSFDETVVSSPHQALCASAFCRCVDPATLERLDAACALLEKECAGGDAIGALMSYLLEIAAPKPVTHPSDHPIHRAMQYIRTYFREDPSLADVAAQVCLSPVYFGNLFKQVTGETFVGYLNTCKVNCAMMLLERGVSVSQACFDSGFGSLSGFLYAFKQKNGISPGEYQKKCRRIPF